MADTIPAVELRGATKHYGIGQDQQVPAVGGLSAEDVIRRAASSAE